MLVLSSPSGAGKSTIARLLLEHSDNLALSISVTTRPRRHSEVEGIHYYLHHHGEARGDARQRRSPRMGVRPRQLLCDAARPGRTGAEKPAGRALRHRLAGHAPAQGGDGRRRGRRVRAAAIDGGTPPPARTASGGQRRGDFAPHRQRARGDPALGRIRLRADQPRPSGILRRGAGDPQPRARRARGATAHRAEPARRPLPARAPAGAFRIRHPASG